MPFPARFDGHCATCGHKIKAGQFISWSRRERGKAYHFNCASPDAIPPTDTVTPAAMPASKMDKSEAIAALLKLLGATTTDTADEAEQPTEAEEKAHTAAITKITKTIARTRITLETNSPWYDVLQALCDGIGNNLIRILLIGPPSTGKSTTAMQVTSTPYRVTMTEGSGVEDLIGMFQLKDGATIWCDGPVVRAMREGKRVLIDEVDHHSTEVGSLMYAILDDHPQIMLPTGESVEAQPGYGVIATTNSNVTALPEAILDRFEAILQAITPHPKATDTMPANMSAAVSSYFRALPVAPWSWSGKPTVRRMKAYHRMLPILGEQHAANLAFGSAGPEMQSVLTTSGR